MSFFCKIHKTSLKKIRIFCYPSLQYDKSIFDMNTNSVTTEVTEFYVIIQTEMRKIKNWFLGDLNSQPWEKCEISWNLHNMKRVLKLAINYDIRRTHKLTGFVLCCVILNKISPVRVPKVTSGGTRNSCRREHRPRGEGDPSGIPTAFYKSLYVKKRKLGSLEGCYCLDLTVRIYETSAEQDCYVRNCTFYFSIL